MSVQEDRIVTKPTYGVICHTSITSIDSPAKPVPKHIKQTSSWDEGYAHNIFVKFLCYSSVNSEHSKKIAVILVQSS